MAKEKIKFSEIKTLKNRFINLRSQIAAVFDRKKSFEKAIEETANKVKNDEFISILSNTPVEELNRDKEGIRVNALREHGLKTVLDVCNTSIYRISAIPGISDNGAYEIKRKADKIALDASQLSRARLSLDNKTANASNLVSYISTYMEEAQYYEEASNLGQYQIQEMNNAFNTLSSQKNRLKWLFIHSDKRENVEKAYYYIKNVVEGEFGKRVNDCYEKVNEAQCVSFDFAWNSFEKNSPKFYSTVEKLAPKVLGEADSQYGLPQEIVEQITNQVFFPNGLTCTLRGYQELGVKYILHQEKVLLGDEMGLGKTVQAIATMVSLKNTGAKHFMVICPASVLTNWCKEITKHSKLTAMRIHGKDKDVAFGNWVKYGGVAVTTFETSQYISFPIDLRCSLIVVDEAHYIKNENTIRGSNVRRLCEKTGRILFMSGTSLENKVDEMVSLIKVLRPDIASKVAGLTSISAAPEFRRIIAPVYYRRKREDVLSELPEKTEIEEWCTMSAPELARYKSSLYNGNYADVRRVSWNMDELSKSSKANRLLEIVAEAKEDGRKILVFTFYLETARAVQRLLGNICMEPINGSVPPARRQEIIDSFDRAAPGSVLVAQIQSGGTGLNIQSASVVIICEPQFKPSIENQAISRAYRMGQTRKVFIHRLLCENSVDEKILDVLKQKQYLFDTFADKSEAASKEVLLDEKGFGQIIQEEIARINAQTN